MKTYPEFIEFDNDLGVIKKVRLYNVDNGIGVYYNLIDNFQIEAGWSIVGLRTISSDIYLDDLKCYEITKVEFFS